MPQIIEIDDFSPPPTSKPKGARMELGDVTRHNIKQMKRLNQIIFPVNYNDKFYTDVQDAGELAKLAYYNDIVVGAVCCRREITENNKHKLYIMTLGCLPAYRRLGLGKMMLEYIFRLCSKHKDIESVYLHVQINNETALNFYKKFGFQVKQLVEGYYKRIEPADAYVLEKDLATSAAAAAAIHEEEENFSKIKINQNY